MAQSDYTQPLSNEEAEKECVNRGWFAVRDTIGWKPASADRADSIPDLNRWRVYEAVGSDVCYD